MGLNSLHDLHLAGVKWELAENPHVCDATKHSEKTAPGTPSLGIPSISESSIIPAIAPMTIAMAQDSAAHAADLSALTNAIIDFKHPLKQFAKNTVRPTFSSDSKLLIITDAPSGDDDECGNILCGAGGDLLDKMLNAIGLSRDNVSIIPMIFWRTPGGRGATREELDLARPFVARAIELLAPRAILTLGTLAALEIAGAKLPKQHGEFVERSGMAPVVPIYHPNYLLLKPDAKRDVWNALQSMQNFLKNP